MFEKSWQFSWNASTPEFRTVAIDTPEVRTRLGNLTKSFQKCAGQKSHLKA
jgi:hypothetical protein